jgi:hypothetical protein
MLRPVLRSIALILHGQDCSETSTQQASNATPLPRHPSARKFTDFAWWYISFSGNLGVRPFPGAVRRLAKAIPSVLENMLLIDYGFGECAMRPLIDEVSFGAYHDFWPCFLDFSAYLAMFVDRCRHGQRPSISEDWSFLLKVLCEFDRHFKVTEVALMIYYYHKHHRELTRSQYLEGMTGYTGVMSELIAEVPSRGPQRLMRKLSLDINKVIPNCVQDRCAREMMIGKAEGLALQYGITLYPIKGLHTKKWSPESQQQRFGKPQGFWSRIISTAIENTTIPKQERKVKSE